MDTLIWKEIASFPRAHSDLVAGDAPLLASKYLWVHVDTRSPPSVGVGQAGKELKLAYNNSG